MNWIQVQLDIVGHRKTRKLSRLLGIENVTAVGHLVAIWTWAISNAPDGDLTQQKSHGLAEVAEYLGDADLFLQALIDAGYIDTGDTGEQLCLHDWQKYTGRLQVTREKNAARARERRSGDPSSLFEEFWKAYLPVHTGKGSKAVAQDRWDRLQQEPASRRVSEEALLEAAKRYIAECHRNNTYTKQADVFLSLTARHFEAYLSTNTATVAKPDSPCPMRDGAQFDQSPGYARFIREQREAAKEQESQS